MPTGVLSLDALLLAHPALQVEQPQRLFRAEEAFPEIEHGACGDRKSVRAGGTIRSAGGAGKRGQTRGAAIQGFAVPFLVPDRPKTLASL